MATQLRLFEFEGTLNYKPHWDLTVLGLDEVAQILITLLNEATADPPGRNLPITVFDIARARMGIPQNEKIAPSEVEVFDKIVKQIRDERANIKAKVELDSDYRLVLVTDTGESSLGNPRRPFHGFALRNSVVGALDDEKQYKLIRGHFINLNKRHPDLEARLISDLHPALPEPEEEPTGR